MTEHGPGLTAMETAPVALDRSTPPADEVGRHEGVFAERARTTQERRLEEVQTESTQIASLLNTSGLQTHDTELSDDLIERVARQTLDELGSNVKLFEVTLPHGSQVLAPPYDTAWSSGSGNIGQAESHGIFEVSTKTESSGAAVGFYISVTEPSDVQITPLGTYTWIMRALQHPSPSVSRGGLNIMVQVNGNPVFERHTTLWNVNGSNLDSPAIGHGEIAWAHTPVSGVWPVYLAPVIIRMDPGQRHLVWLWAWSQTAQIHGISGAMGVSLPMVKVDSAPPIVL